MNITHVMRTGFAAVLCLALSISSAVAADVPDQDFWTVPSLETESRPDIAKDPAALEAASIPTASSASVTELPPTDATSTDVALTSGNALPITGFAMIKMPNSTLQAPAR